MARFDLLTDTTKQVAYLLDVQSDFLNHLNTRLVIPVMLAEKLDKPLIRYLHVPFIFRDRSLVILTDLMTSIPLNLCGKAQASLKDRSHDITAAINFLLQGF